MSKASEKAAKAAALAAKNEPVNNTPTQKEQVISISLTDLQALIAKEVASAKTEDTKPKKLKRSTEHYVHVWRLQGKWITDFVDQNVKKDGSEEKVDDYIKEKIHAWQKWNEQKREYEAWIELKFQDGTTLPIALQTYIKNRLPIYCLITKREKIDASYDVGEIEKKKEVGDKLVGTGVMIPQEVEIYEEVFHLKTPDGQEFVLPSYVIA